MRLVCHLAGVLVCIALPATASGVKVIANPQLNVTRVSPGDLKDIFLQTKTSLVGANHVEPVLLKSGAAHELFVQWHIGKTVTTLMNYYRSLVFAGKGTMPQMLESDAEVVAYVARTKGAIGYVSEETITRDVKILEVK
jgi:ABC-type phosphate transport system substrate-binding protein